MCKILKYCKCIEKVALENENKKSKRQINVKGKNVGGALKLRYQNVYEILVLTDELLTWRKFEN